MPYIVIIFALFISSCANNQRVLNSNFAMVKSLKTGALLTIDLDTSERIKRGQRCKLVIGQNNKEYRMTLKEGIYNYALPLESGTAQIKELNCGLFYYYKLVDRGAFFEVKNGTISYLGTLDFQLEDKGEMTWGPSTKSTRLLTGNLNEMGLSSEEVVIAPLKL